MALIHIEDLPALKGCEFRIEGEPAEIALLLYRPMIADETFFRAAQAALEMAAKDLASGKMYKTVQLPPIVHPSQN